MVNGNRVRLARELRRYTQEQLGDAAGVVQAAIARIEGGELKPSESVVSAIAMRTGFPVSFFFRPDDLDFSLGSLLFRAHAAASGRDRSEAYRHAQIVLECALHLMRRTKWPTLRVPQLSGAAPEVAATVARAQLGLAPDRPIENLTETLERAGVLILALPVVLEGRDAFSLWFGQEHTLPVIFLAAGRSGDRQRFSLAHELGHLVLHQAIRGPVAAVEEEANRFAAELLLPKGGVENDLITPVTLHRLERLKPKWKVAIQALIRRTFELGIISKRQYTYLFEQVGARGWRTREPSHLDILPEKPRALRKMAELQYGNPIHFAKLGDAMDLPTAFVKEIFEGHAEWHGKRSKRPAPLVSIVGRRTSRVPEPGRLRRPTETTLFRKRNTERRPRDARAPRAIRPPDAVCAKCSLRSAGPGRRHGREVCDRREAS